MGECKHQTERAKTENVKCYRQKNIKRGIRWMSKTIKERMMTKLNEQIKDKRITERRQNVK